MHHDNFNRRFNEANRQKSDCKKTLKIKGETAFTEAKWLFAMCVCEWRSKIVAARAKHRAYSFPRSSYICNVKGLQKKRALFLRRFFAFQAHGLLRDDFSQRKIVSREIKFHTPKIFLNFFSVFFSQSRKSRLISPSRLKLINVWRRLTNQSWMALIQVWLRSTGGSYKMDTRWTTNVDDEDRLTKATYQGPPPKPPPPIRMFWIAW